MKIGNNKNHLMWYNRPGPNEGISNNRIQVHIIGIVSGRLLLNSVHKRNLWYKRIFEAYFRLNKCYKSPAGIVPMQKLKIKKHPMVSCLSLWFYYKFSVRDRVIFWFQFSVSFRLVLLLLFINLNISRNHCSENYTYSIDFRNLYGSSVSCFFNLVLRD